MITALVSLLKATRIVCFFNLHLRMNYVKYVLMGIFFFAKTKKEGEIESLFGFAYSEGPVGCYAYDRGYDNGYCNGYFCRD
jgi:hypothetical protein